MNNSAYKTNNLNNKDIQAVANIHESDLNTSFLAQLGSGFLFYLYKSINECHESELIITKEGDEVTGFVTGAVSLKPIYIHLIKNYFFRATFKLVPHLFNISKAKKILEVLRYSKKEDTADHANIPKVELLSIAVKENYRGSGIAQQLFKTLSERFKEKGYDDFKIIVGNELKAAQIFYKKMGAIEVGSTMLHQGEDSLILKVKL